MRKSLALACVATLLSLSAFAGEGFLKGKILKIDMQDAVSERGGSAITLGLGGLSSSSSLSLLSIERALENAVDDDDIAMIYINYDHFRVGMASAEEIRGFLQAFSAKGKPVVAYGASLDNASYYLASTADRIFLHPKGGGALTGLGTTQFFIKDLLDTLAIDIQLIRHGKFKSAGEMYIRNDISPENRQQYEELLGSIWGGMVDEMAGSRGKSSEEMMALVDGLKLSTAQTWIDNGLVDGLKYRDEMEDYLAHLFGTDNPADVKTISLKKYIKDLDKGPSSKKVAIIYADGEIVRSGSDVVGEKLAHQIASVRKDSTVKAVVFRVNSPGGEVVAADIIRREIELLGKVKPVVASYGSYAASGGYLISAGCERIFVDNATLTGSIGVFGVVRSVGRAVHKNLKVNMVSVGTNAHSDMTSGARPLNEEELAWYQAEIEGIYDDFVGVVAEGRSMDKDAVDEIAQGRVWSGKDALGLGLADEKGTLMDAVKYAAGRKNLKKYRIAVYPEKKSLKDKLSGKEKSDDNLVRIQDLLSPGFNTIARMPYVTIDSPKNTLK